MKQPVIIILSEHARTIAQKISAEINGEIHGYSARVENAEILFDDVKSHIRSLFGAGVPIVAVMASGAVIRILAPVMGDKNIDPPVLAVSDDGSSIVPLLGGHHGANDMARAIANAIDGHAAVTTAGDLRFGVALDNPPNGLVLGNPENAKDVMAALLAGKNARLSGTSKWLSGSSIPFSGDGEVLLTVTDQVKTPEPLELVFHPRTLVLGLGCERGADAAEVIELAQRALEQGGFTAKSLGCVTSIDLKADEAAIHSAAEHFGVETRFFTATELEKQTPRLKNPSDIVFAEVGCHGVCEAAALAAGGETSDLVVPKIKSKRATAALSRAPDTIFASKVGTARGRLFVVGIGPGQEAWRSPEVTRMIGASTDLVGYSLYLDLVSEIAKGKTRHDFDLGKEEDRVRHAMELAGQGKDVSLVCSGDAGIYAMATLVFELLAHGDLSGNAKRIAIEISPGISALQAAASRAGAPLGHDFCTISLSDLLTPWEAIQMRIKAAAEGDFVVAFYNPVSKRRRKQLAYAREALLQHRPADTPVILATNLGRQGEAVRVVPLDRLNVDDVDMLTVVIVGSSETKTVMTGDGREWVYTPRGYAGKTGSNINKQAAE